MVKVLKLDKNSPSPIKLRPISLINSLSKVFEGLLLTHLNIYTAHKIRHEQFGFRRQHSTSLQLVNVLDDIISKHNGCFKTFAVLFDVEKVFDKISHTGFVILLIALGVLAQLIKILKPILRKCKKGEKFLIQ